MCTYECVCVYVCVCGLPWLLWYHLGRTRWRGRLVLCGCGLPTRMRPPAPLPLPPSTTTPPPRSQACYRTEGVNYRKKCAAVVAQYEAVHRAPGAPPAAAATEEE